MKLQAVPSLSAKGYGIFQTHVFQAISGETREALLAAIRSERDGEANFDGDLVKTVCSIFIELGLYVSTGHELQHSVVHPLQELVSLQFLQIFSHTAILVL